MSKNYKTSSLAPRQSSYLRAYSDPTSPSFGNSYKSAVRAGYSKQTAKNLIHLKPEWLSENIETISNKVIQPEEITAVLSHVIYSTEEPTLIKLRAIELMMKFYKMLNNDVGADKTVNISIDLSGKN